AFVGQPPHVFGVTPTSAQKCDFIYIDGSNFGSDPGSVSVTWNGIQLNVVSVKDDQIVAQVPSNTITDGSGHIVTVTTTWGSASTEDLLFVSDAGFGKCPTMPGHGLLGKVYILDANTSSLPDIGGQGCSDSKLDSAQPCPFNTILIANPDVPDQDWSLGFPGAGTPQDEWFAIRFTGTIDLPAGSTEFRLCSDDGSKLWIGQPLDPTTTATTTPVIDNDGVQSVTCKNGSFAAGAGGNFDIILDYFQGPRVRIALTLEWKRPGDSAFSIVPESALHLP
ncbi:MAG: IPT/TIG domain-containing protein, partial [Myxococcales bacterium]|nr:IPT/TIG domain-containing protein [Myxococcales bacterium]